MIGIYRIRNKANGMMYIGSTINFNKRVIHHRSSLKCGNHQNVGLQEDYDIYGSDSFVYEMVKEFDRIGTHQLRLQERIEIDSHNFDDLYNVVKDTFGGGAEVHCKETYLLDLKGNILKAFNSTIECYKYLGYRNPDYSYLNTSTKRSRFYRIVTKEFYDNNYKEIMTWDSLTSFDKRKQAKRLIQLRKMITVTDIVTGSTTEYNNMKEFANKIGRHVETVRLAIKNNRLVSERFKVSKLVK